MEIFLVGGAVRDQLLDRPIGDRDYVVVGASADAMLAQGFKPVGKDFPVFIHPKTGEEYALARTERKSGRGYHGFVFHADNEVTLEQDLARRDFTINAIAQNQRGELIDPFDGQRDIANKLLRHVSPAFAEDPVRILRAARFMARYASLGFQVAEQTQTLMRHMVASGEVDHLVPERVWQELVRALGEPTPSAFLQTLRQCGALQRILPEINALYGVPQRPEFHPEIDCGIHTEMVCDIAARLAPRDSCIGFAGLTHDLGKALTPADMLPRHKGHEETGLVPLSALCDRLRVPNKYRQLAQIVCREHLNVHRIDELRPGSLHDLIERCSGFRQPELIEQLAIACEADKRGRLGLSETPYPSAEILRNVLRAGLSIRAKDLPIEGLDGPQIGELMRRARIKAIAKVRKDVDQ